MIYQQQNRVVFHSYARLLECMRINDLNVYQWQDYENHFWDDTRHVAMKSPYVEYIYNISSMSSNGV